MKKLNILQISNTYFPTSGGTEIAVSNLAKGLTALGHNVDVLTTTLYAKDSQLGEQIIDGINVFRCKNDTFALGFGFSSSFPFELKKIWKKYDVIHIHGFSRFASEYSLFYLHNKKPLVFTGHGFNHTSANLHFKTIHNLTLGKLVNYADYCTALNPLEYEKYSKLNVDKSKVVDLGNGVNISAFKKPLPKKEILSLQQEWKKLKNEKIILYVGRIHKSKGLHYLLKAVENYSIFRVVLIGTDAGYLSSLQDLAKQLKIEDRVVFYGKISNEKLPLAYQSADIFCLPSEMEGFGIVLVEAMASGIPIITSDRGAMPFLIKNNYNGLNVPFADSVELGKKLFELISKPNLMKKFASNAKVVADKYSIESVSKQAEKIYFDAIESFNKTHKI